MKTADQAGVIQLIWGAHASGVPVAALRRDPRHSDFRSEMRQFVEIQI
jgi:hypothetical protein